MFEQEWQVGKTDDANDHGAPDMPDRFIRMHSAQFREGQYDGLYTD